MAQVIRLEWCAVATQRYSQLSTHRALIPLQVDLRQAPMDERPLLDPGFRNRQSLAGPRFASTDCHQAIGLHLGLHQSFMGAGAIGGTDACDPLPIGRQGVDDHNDHRITGQHTWSGILLRAIALAQLLELLHNVRS